MLDHRYRRITTAAVAGVLLLAGCGGESASERLENMSNEEWNELSESEQLDLMQDAAAEIGNDAGEVEQENEPVGAEGDAGPLLPGEVYTYADGLEITVSEPYEQNSPGTVPSRFLAIDLIATNPTDEVITTTQAWVSLTAGDTGEAPDWYDGHLEAILQPGAEASEPYTYDLPLGTQHITATVQWLESETREDAVFTVTP